MGPYLTSQDPATSPAQRGGAIRRAVVMALSTGLATAAAAAAAAPLRQLATAACRILRQR